MQRFVRSLLIGAMLLSAVLVFSYAGHPEKKDFISYWSAARLLRDGGNPYSASEVQVLEHLNGFAGDVPLVMRNPPPALFLVAPLGYLSLRGGLIVWTALMIGCIFSYFKLMTVSASGRLLTYIFAPFIACIYSGQSSPILLLGLTLFLRFNEESPWLAATGLFCLAMKPHLFAGFWAVFMLDGLYRKRFNLLARFSVVVVSLSLLAVVVWPGSWHQYVGLARSAKLQDEFLQTPAYLLRHFLAPKVLWVQLLPMALAAIWSVAFYWCRRHEWCWRNHAPVLILISVLAAPYGWLTDEIVLLPALMLAIDQTRKRKHSLAIFVTISMAANALLAMGLSLTSGVYIWTSCAWALWFRWSSRGIPHAHTSASDAGRMARSLFGSPRSSFD